VKASARLAGAGVEVILESKHPSRVERGIVVAAGTAKRLQVPTSDAAEFHLLDEFMAGHRRHRDFATSRPSYP